MEELFDQTTSTWYLQNYKSLFVWRFFHQIRIGGEIPIPGDVSYMYLFGPRQIYRTYTSIYLLLQTYAHFLTFLYTPFSSMLRVIWRRFFHFFYSPCPGYLLNITNILTFPIHRSIFPPIAIPYITCNIYNCQFTYGRLLTFPIHPRFSVFPLRGVL